MRGHSTRLRGPTQCETLIVALPHCFVASAAHHYDHQSAAVPHTPSAPAIVCFVVRLMRNKPQNPDDPQGAATDRLLSIATSCECRWEKGSSSTVEALRRFDPLSCFARAGLAREIPSIQSLPSCQVTKCAKSRSPLRRIRSCGQGVGQRVDRRSCDTASCSRCCLLYSFGSQLQRYYSCLLPPEYLFEMCTVFS